MVLYNWPGYSSWQLWFDNSASATKKGLKLIIVKNHVLLAVVHAAWKALHAVFRETPSRLVDLLKIPATSASNIPAHPTLRAVALFMDWRNEGVYIIPLYCCACKRSSHVMRCSSFGLSLFDSMCTSLAFELAGSCMCVWLLFACVCVCLQACGPACAPAADSVSIRWQPTWVPD